MAPRSILDNVLAGIDNPEEGLPDEVFNFIRQVTPLVNVDLLIQRYGRTLLAWRDDEYESGWHIPGGIVRFRESLQSRIDAVALLELGVVVDSEPVACAVNELQHHKRGHFLSFLYRCRLAREIEPSRMYSGRGSPSNGALCWISGVPSDLYPAQSFYSSWLNGGS